MAEVGSHDEIWRQSRVYHIWLSLCTRTWPVQTCLLSLPSFCRLFSQVRCCSVVGATAGACKFRASFSLPCSAPCVSKRRSARRPVAFKRFVPSEIALWSFFAFILARIARRCENNCRMTGHTRCPYCRRPLAGRGRQQMRDARSGPYGGPPPRGSVAVAPLVPVLFCNRRRQNIERAVCQDWHGSIHGGLPRVRTFFVVAAAGGISGMLLVSFADRLRWSVGSAENPDAKAQPRSALARSLPDSCCARLR